MSRKYGLIFPGLFFVVLATYVAIGIAYTSGLLDLENVEIIDYLFIPPLFLFFVLGVCSSMLSLAVRLSENDFLLMENFRTNPIRYIVWAEVREDVIRQHETRRRERAKSEPRV